MGIQGIFGGNFALLEKSLSLRSRRHELIVSNIANADTPEYKSFDIVIENELQKSSGSSGSTPLKTTDAGHMQRRGGTVFDQVTLHKDESNELSLRGDGNTVDMDKEMVNIAENALHYRTSAQILKKMFGALRTVITGSN